MRQETARFLLVTALIFSTAPTGFASDQAAPAGPAPGATTHWWSQARAGIAALEYEVTWQERTALEDLPRAWHAPNRAHDLRTYFTEDGIRIVRRTEIVPSWELGLTWVGYGAGNSSSAVPPAVLAPDGNRIEYDRGAHTEWYINTPRGLEQGFTLGTPPDVGTPADEAADTDLIHLDLALRGSLSPRLSADRQAVDFVSSSGARTVRYDHLHVQDAAGRVLPSWMEVHTRAEGPRIRLVVDAGDAVFPLTVDPLATSPAWTAESDQGSAFLGWSVGTAGDVNGDGYSDVIVGAHQYDLGFGLNAGRAYVYHGSASGPALAPSWTLDSQQSAAFLGRSVATAGDVNGDGYSDVIVGATSYDSGESNEGKVFLFHGSATGLSGGPGAGPADADWTAEADLAEADFGYSVGPAGDVNGDGYGDVIIGAIKFDDGEADEGMAFVYHGSASGLSGGPAASSSDADWTVQSDQAIAQLGHVVGTAGDVNGDGYGDVIVTARLYDNGEAEEGMALVYHGSAGGLSGGPEADPLDADWTAESDQALANLGYSACTAGDVNGDGYADVIVGARTFDSGESNEGRAFVYHGSASGLTGGPGAGPADADWTVESDQADAQLGHSVATAGDIDGDGYADVLVGVHLYDNVEVNEGGAFLYLGLASGLAGGPAADLADAAWAAEADQAGAFFGQSVAPAGDVNGDGFSDVIVGASEYTNGQAGEGGAFVYLGGPGALSGGPAALLSAADWTAEGDQVVAYFGGSVASAGDVNGDGFGDLIVGAGNFDPDGKVFVFHGGEGGPGSVADWTLEGSGVEGGGTAGDVNGDGYEDVILSAGNLDLGSDGALVVLDSATGLAGGPAADATDAQWTFVSDQGGPMFGVIAGTAGDVNGDGYAEVIIGAPEYAQGFFEEGAAFLFYGSPAGVEGGPLVGPQDAAWTLGGGVNSSELGRSVATAGDVNSDGFGDVIIGAPGYSALTPDGFASGAAFVYHGSAAGLTGSTIASVLDSDWTVYGVNPPGARVGEVVASAGDVDGDGYSDVIVGGPFLWSSGAISDVGGVTFVYGGSASGLLNRGRYDDIATIWYVEGGTNRIGRAAASAGDVNGDGLADVIVGDWLHSNGETEEGGAWVFHGPPTGNTLAGADWSVESDQASAKLGWSLGSAGDVDGDGFADIIIGARMFDNGQVDEGAAFVYRGNAGGGIALAPQQRRADDAAPVAPQGVSDAADAVRLAMRARTPFGRGEVRLEREVKLLGTPLDGSATQLTGWTDSGLSGIALDDLVTGLAPASVHHWRFRVRYNPAITPFQLAGPWVRHRADRLQAADLRTPVNADLALAVTDTDPALEGGDIVYTLGVSNAGPGATDATVVQDLPEGVTLVSMVPSQGSCSSAFPPFTAFERVTCDSGSVPASGAASVIVTVTTPTGPADWTSRIRVAPAGDLDPGNNSQVETTTSVPPALGDRVWEDLDGDGVQDPGEPGLPGVWIIVVDAGGSAVGATQTDASGQYSLGGLTVGASYSGPFFEPFTHVFSPADQGADDLLDSDVDPFLGETPLTPLTDGLAPQRWDAGMIPACVPPDEAIFVESVVLGPGNEAVLSFQDFNQPAQVTGYNVYRSDDPSPPPATWPLVASDIVDGDEATPNIQWADTSGDVPPSGIRYYEVTAVNSRCPAEGPF